MTPVLQASELVVEYVTRKERVRALDHASLQVNTGEVVGVVGESGSGKSTMGAALAGALDRPARLLEGEVLIDGTSTQQLSDVELAELRRSKLGAVFQDPIGTMDPTAKVGRQMQWALGRRLSDSEIRQLLAEVHLQPDVVNAYPHQLSGGMAQRVSIALALAHQPAAVIADEPTASLDASIRIEILELLVARARERNTSVVVITHDLASVRRFCDKVVVLYGGRVVEEARTSTLFDDPQHPYTRALLGSALGHEQPGEVVLPIQGQPPLLRGACPGCAFSGRCPSELDHCSSVRPEHRQVGEADVLCHLYDALPLVSSGSQSRTAARRG